VVVVPGILLLVTRAKMLKPAVETSSHPKAQNV